MYPILFPKNATQFNTNGIGRLSDVHSCIVEETLNGIFEMEMKCGVSGEHFSDIEMLSVIQTKANALSGLQAFDVYNITKPINKVATVNARHVRYRLNKNVCMPFSVASAPTACASALTGLKTNAVESCPFTFSTDVTTAAGYNQVIPATIGERLAGVEGSVLDQFGGQYEFDNFTVTLHSHRGRINTGVSIKYGKNLTDIAQDTNIANTVVGIVPFWSDADGTDVVTLTEKVVYSNNASSYPRKMIIPYDFSALFQDKPTESSLRSAAQAYVSQSDFGVPKVSIKLSFVPLWETEEYKDYAPLEALGLGDEVTVLFEELGISTTAQVVGYRYDCLRERYISMDIGNIRSNFAATLTDQEAKTIQTIDLGNQKVLRQANATAVDAINNATKWLTGSNGYVVAVKDTNGTWKELLFMDTNNTQTATNVLRINTNGIGFSTTGINGPYTNAWTIDGNLVASFIKVGILSDLAGKFSLNMTTGALNMKDGTFEGTINGSTINVGTFQSVEGNINVYDTSGRLIYKLSKNGLTSYATLEGGSNTYYTIEYAKNGYSTDVNGNTIYMPSAIVYNNVYGQAFAYIGLRGSSLTPDLVIKDISNGVDIEGLTATIWGKNGFNIVSDESNIFSSSGNLYIDSDNAIFIRPDDGIEVDTGSDILLNFLTGYPEGEIKLECEGTGGLSETFTGWTGTRNGLKFVKGICVGTA